MFAGRQVQCRAAWAPLGITFFAAAVAVAGVPPLAGFMGKALLLQAAGTTGWAGVPTYSLISKGLMAENE